MSKKDSIELFELFRGGKPGETGRLTVDTMTEPAPKPVTKIVTAPAPKPAPVAAAPKPTVDDIPAAGDTVISMKLNTALFGLMVGAACLFGSFALGVQWERRHAPEPVAVEVSASEPSIPAPAPKRETPVVKKETPRTEEITTGPTRVTETAKSPTKGFALQLMCYPTSDPTSAGKLCERIRAAGGGDAIVITTDTEIKVLAGFVEKRSGAEADALLRKYTKIRNELGKPLQLDWIPTSR